MLDPKRRRRPETRPDEILDAALAVFSEKGFAAARVEDVATRAGLSKGAVYLYFDSKEALIAALVKRFATDVVAQAAERFTALAQTDPVETLRAAQRYLMTALDDPVISAAPRLVLAEAQRFPAIAQLYRREVIAMGQGMITALIDQGVARGVFRDVSRPAAMRAVMGPVLAHMFLTHIFPDPDAAPLDPGEMADSLIDITLHGLIPRTSSNETSS